MNSPQMIEMKGDVLRFIRQDARANLIENRIARAPLEHAIIGCADQLRDEQHLNFEVQSERTARGAEKQVRPMALDQSPPNLCTSDASRRACSASSATNNSSARR